VMRSGGYLYVRIPNLWGYVSILSKLIPNQCHASVTEKVQGGRRKMCFPLITGAIVSTR